MAMVPEHIVGALARQIRGLTEGSAGGRLGWKIAFNTAAAQAATGLRSAFVAGLPVKALRSSDSTFTVAGHTQLIAEAELAVRLGRDISANASVGAIRASISSYAAAVEVTDTDLPLDQLEAIVEGGIFHKGLYLGEFVDLADELPDARGLFGDWPTTVSVNGETAIELNTRQATGDPCAVLATLTRQLATVGERLLAGEIVILGCMHAVVAPKQGDYVEVKMRGSASRCRFG